MPSREKTSRISNTGIFRLNLILRAHRHTHSIGARPARSAALPITSKDKFDCIYYMHLRQQSVL